MENYPKIIQYINYYGLSADQLLDMMLNWHGTDIIEYEFVEFMEQELEG